MKILCILGTRPEAIKLAPVVKKPNIVLTPPLDYVSMVHLLRRSYLALTDSGGLQEEAPGLGVPVLVLREVTERPEGVEAGAVRVVGTSRERIEAEASRLLEDDESYRQLALARSSGVRPGHPGLADVRR